MTVYTQAIDLFVAENQQSDANKCRLKVAQFQAEAEQYEDAFRVGRTATGIGRTP